MDHLLLTLHSWFRWLVLLSLLYSLFRAYRGVRHQKLFSALDNSIRHWTATIAHIQLVLGFTLYIKSPVTRFFFSNLPQAAIHLESLFFSLIHILLMLIAIVLITIGSSLAKRKATDIEKFKTMLYWFAAALLLILIAIPWPFSPLAQRPYFRNF